MRAAPRVDPDVCASEALEVTRSMRVRVASVDPGPALGGGEGQGGGGPVLFYVKSLSSSVDELPVIAAVMEAASNWPEGVEVYEYEDIGGAGDRYRRLARLLQVAMESRRPFIALVPELMTVRLLSALPHGTAESLESSVLAVVKTEKEDMLYMPRYAPPGGVEVVAKESSASSPARAALLSRRLERAGLRVRGVKRLPDNSSIRGYVLERGLCTALERLPVTRLARLIYSLYRCTGLGGLVEPLRTGPGEGGDESRLTLYAYQLPRGVSADVVDAVESLASYGWVAVAHLSHAARGLIGESLERAVRRDVEKLLDSWWCTST